MELERSSDDSVESRKGDRKDQRARATTLVAGAVLGSALLAFVLQNTATVQLTWLFFSFDSPLWVMVVLVALASIGLGKAVGYSFRRSRRRSAESSRHELDKI